MAVSRLVHPDQGTDLLAEGRHVSQGRQAGLCTLAAARTGPRGVDIQRPAQ